jgi:putative transposase
VLRRSLPGTVSLAKCSTRWWQPRTGKALINPSDQKLRRNDLPVVIKGIHAYSRKTFGSRRVHVELTQGLGIQVSKPTVEKIMASSGLYGLPSKGKYRNKTNIATASDLV